MLFENIINLKTFIVFPEYFISISIIYILIVTVLVTYNVYNLMINKALSECMSLILLMTCYLIFNDDLITVNFSTFNHSIITDFLASFAKFTICFFSACYFLISANFLKEQKLTSFEYLLITLFAVLGLLLMCSSNDLLTAYLSIELSSLAFYVLSSFKKTSTYSVESGLKYFIIGAISSAFFLLGSSFIYGILGTINFTNFHDLCQTFLDFFPGESDDPEEDFLYYEILLLFREPIHLIQLLTILGEPIIYKFNYSFIELGLTFILFSLFIKLALAPFHLWSLDVYEGSPTNSTFFFSVITKLSIFILLIRLCYVSFFDSIDCWQFYTLWISLFSIFIGSFGGLKQRKLKTLLAYSSISHMGYALLAFSTGSLFGLQMLLLYIIIYMTSGLSIWFIILLLRVKTKTINNKYSKELSDLALLKKSNPALALAFSFTMFSVAGIPPMIGFLAKMSVFLSVIRMSFYYFALISILLSVISTFYYIRIIKVLYFENLLVGKLYYPIQNSKTLILSILTFLLIFLFINPNLLYLLAHKAILSIN